MECRHFIQTYRIYSRILRTPTFQQFIQIFKKFAFIAQLFFRVAGDEICRAVPLDATRSVPVCQQAIFRLAGWLLLSACRRVRGGEGLLKAGLLE